MNKLLLVAMTLLAVPAMGDVKLELRLKEDHQIIKVVDAEYQWMIDVECNQQLDVEKLTDITVSKDRVQVGKSIKVKQDGKEQTCLVNQMAITSVW
jgi:hypothetical protein